MLLKIKGVFPCPCGHYESDVPRNAQKHAKSCRYFLNSDNPSDEHTIPNSQVYLKSSPMFKVGPKIGNHEFVVHLGTGLVGLTGVVEFVTMDRIDRLLKAVKIEDEQVTEEMKTELVDQLLAAEDESDARVLHLLSTFLVKIPLLPSINDKLGSRCDGCKHIYNGRKSHTAHKCKSSSDKVELTGIPYQEVKINGSLVKIEVATVDESPLEFDPNDPLDKYMDESLAEMAKQNLGYVHLNSLKSDTDF